MGNYKLKLDVFEGPLDLLLFLIKKNDLEIKDIPISQITEQYLEYIDMMKMLDLDIVGDFLVMAATLMQIKSRMLLPPDPVEVNPNAADPRDELVQRLLEYNRFKEIASDLQQKENYRQDLFARALDEERTKQLRDDAREVFVDTSLFDLITALTDALKKVPEDKLHEVIRDEFTVEQKIHDVLHYLIDKPQIRLSDLFGKARSKGEVIVTFLAVLELIRLKEVRVVQKKLFDEIEVWRNKENMLPPNVSES